jgi:hypothetical protein
MEEAIFEILLSQALHDWLIVFNIIPGPTWVLVSVKGCGYLGCLLFYARIRPQKTGLSIYHERNACWAVSNGFLEFNRNIDSLGGSRTLVAISTRLVCIPVWYVYDHLTPTNGLILAERTWSESYKYLVRDIWSCNHVIWIWEVETSLCIPHRVSKVPALNATIPLRITKSSSSMHQVIM